MHIGLKDNYDDGDDDDKTINIILVPVLCYILDRNTHRGQVKNIETY